MTKNNESKNTAPVSDVKTMVDDLCAKAKAALQEFLSYDQEQVDKIIEKMTYAGLAAQIELSQFAVEETGRGVFEDKITKNVYAVEFVYNNIRNLKTVGVIENNPYEHIEVIAEPVGVIAAVTPVTNPTSTTMFKIISALKARNPIIFGFHPSAQKCSSRAAEILYAAALEAGAPENCIQWISEPSLEASNALMNHPDVDLILATGGSGMVRAAYSTGKPALGVGPGNTPAYIHKSADLKRAATDILTSKTFDNGMICASEQAVIVDREISEEFEAYMKFNKCYFCNEAEIKKLTAACFKETGALNADIVGKTPHYIAGLAGIDVAEETKILMAQIPDATDEYMLSHEKLSPVLAYIVVDSTEEGISMAEKMLAQGGMGHTSCIHARDEEVIQEFGRRLKSGRLIVNSPTSHGGIGDIYNWLTPSLTLGCGSYGHNSTTDNVSVMNLMNKKRMARRRKNMQWFKVPPKIFFEPDATQYLAVMEGIERIFIVTDPAMAKLGYVDKINHYLAQRTNKVQTYLFAEVEPDPSLDTLKKGVAAMNIFKPDTIVALGGGSSMDAAKGMWLFYEHPDADFKAMKEKFLDIRKRTVKFPKMGSKCKLVCMPTTSGTGSEVTSFAVITDKETNNKYPLADYELTPDVAIIDPSYTMTVPQGITADTGLDALTHAIEAYVSIMATDYTDGLCMQAIRLVFEWLPVVYNDPSNEEGRYHMANASCLAGMAFTNAFLGINHSLAHKLGAAFRVPHGRANAVLMPHVIEYNAQHPTKFTNFARYDHYVADERYAKIARELGFPASTTEEGVQSLISEIKKLMQSLNVPFTLRECGVKEKEYMDAIGELALKAFDDQCTTANPRLPKVTELEEIYRKIY